MKALGMIELYGYLPAVEALDSALKAANVSLVDTVCVKGGLVTVLVEGDVGAVKAAMDASAAAAERVGTVISVHVIPRPAEEVMEMIRKDRQHPIQPTPDPEPGAPVSPASVTEEEETPSDKPQEPEPAEEAMTDSEESAEVVTQPTGEVPSEEELNGMTVAALRTLARTLGVTSLSRQQIRFAKKQELIHAIIELKGQEK